MLSFGYIPIENRKEGSNNDTFGNAEFDGK